MKNVFAGAKVFQLMALLWILIPCAAQGAMVEVRPTLLSITPAQRIAVLSLINPEANPVVYQIQLYRWRQIGDKQTLEPTNDLIASPPIVSLAGYGSQIVRVGLRAAENLSQEKSYRLILEEIPVLDTMETQSLNVALHVSLPLFVRPQAVLPPVQLAATMRLSGKNAVVTVMNKGAFTTRIAGATLRVPDAAQQEIKTLTYILPEGWNSYTFTLPAMPANLQAATLSLQVDAGVIDLEVPVVPETISDASAPAVH